MATRPSRRFLAAAVLALLAAPVLAACGDGDDDTASAEDAASADHGGDGGAADDGSASGDGGEVPSDDGGVVTTGTSGSGALGDDVAVTNAADATSGRSIVFTGSITVEVENLVAAGENAAVAAESLGGFVAAEQSGFGTDPSTIVTLRVPPDGFRTLISRLGALGTVTSQNVDSTDVTERVVDLESRIDTAAVSVERLREFLAAATTTSDVRELEAELVSRESELEQLRGELRSVQSRVSLSTVVATLLPEPDDVPVVVEPDDDDLPGFAEALGGGWDAFRRIGSGIVIGVLAALPFVGATALIAVAGWLAVRRRHRTALTAGAQNPPRAL